MGSMPRSLLLWSAAGFAWLLAAPLLAQTPATHHHSFADAPRWAKVFDDPARDAWQKPHEVIMALKLAPDAIVADIGAGTGYFALRLAHALPAGRVYGTDTEAQMVAYLDQRAKQAGVQNIIAVRASSATGGTAGTAGATGLSEKVDLALLVNVYHHIDDRVAYFGKLREQLKPGGRIAIIDFHARSPVGPPVRERLSAAQVRDEMRAAGFRVIEEPGFLPHQYFLIFGAGG